MTVHCEHVPNDPDPLRLLSADLPPGLLRSSARTRLFWSAPDTGVTIAGLGCVWEIRADALRDVLPRLGAGGRFGAFGQERAQMSTPAAADVPRATSDYGLAQGGAPAFVALPFDPHWSRTSPRLDPRWGGLDGVRVVVPEVCAMRDADGTRLTTAWPSDTMHDVRDRSRRIVEALQIVTDVAPVKPVAVSRVPLRLARSERAALRRRIRKCVEAINQHRADKVVIGTSHTVQCEPVFDPVRLLAGLEDEIGAFRFMVQRSPDRAFVGASPERLIAVQGAKAITMALAGSTARGADPATDRALGKALLESAKDRAEHQWVVDALVQALAPVAVEMKVDQIPRLKRLATVQHLETPIELQLERHMHVLDLAELLQPTPALGGTPRDAALSIIRELEPSDRGWYGGAVGWVDADGNGDLAVAIRCMLRQDQGATAFAGAGIVADSDPEAEVGEIELKLGSVLRYVP